MIQAKRIFSYEEACRLLPEVQQITVVAAAELEALVFSSPDELEHDELPVEVADDYNRIVGTWADSVMAMGIEVKGLWLIDFDNGSGYYCWKYPEPALEYFHGYEEGFRGRVKLN